jgi:hypothetical protein
MAAGCISPELRLGIATASATSQVGPDSAESQGRGTVSFGCQSPKGSGVDIAGLKVRRPQATEAARLGLGIAGSETARLGTWHLLSPKGPVPREAREAGAKAERLGAGSVPQCPTKMPNEGGEAFVGDRKARRFRHHTTSRRAWCQLQERVKGGAPNRRGVVERPLPALAR